MPFGYPYQIHFYFTPLFLFHTFIFQTYNGNGYYLPTAMPYGYPYSFPMSNSGSSSVPSNSNQTYFLDLPPATTMSSGKAAWMVLPIHLQLQQTLSDLHIVNMKLSATVKSAPKLTLSELLVHHKMCTRCQLWSWTSGAQGFALFCNQR